MLDSVALGKAIRQIEKLNVLLNSPPVTQALKDVNSPESNRLLELANSPETQEAFDCLKAYELEEIQKS
ncbi:MAG: hypothetical protein HFF62_14025 [Oscillospiraceae bacterium]|nr:hypothetical protein [Oscillospiraceae bacterium]